MARSVRPTTYFVIGESRTNADNSITMIYGSFYMGFEVEAGTHKVVGFNCTHTLELTEDYLRRLFMGENFLEIDQWLEDTLKKFYGGSSRKAVVTSYHDALKRYNTMCREEG